MITGVQQRPRIKIPFTRTDRFLEFSGWAILAILWVFVLFNYSALPDTIPTHFNASGKPDGFDKKISILLIPAIATIFYVGLTLLNRVPHIFNYIQEVTFQNAREQYRRATLIVRYLKFGLVILFGFITHQSVQISLGREKDLGSWVLPLILFSSFSFVIYTIITLSKKVPSENN